MSSRALALASLALCACTRAVVPGESEQAIVGGTADTGDPAVVLVIAEVGTMASLCTGEVVSPHVVLTAAHCLDPSVVGMGATYKVYSGNNITTAHPSDLLAVKETHFDMQFNIKDLPSGHDVGVVILENPINVTPMVMNRMSIGNSQVNQSVRLVGFGITSSTDTMGQTAGIKRQTTTTLGGVTGTLLEFSDPNHLTCEGDSGGPALMMYGGQEVIVGITSFGDQACMQMSDDTRIDLYADSFVQPYIDQFDPTASGGFPPGSIGADCAGSAECSSNVCAHSGSSGFCTAMCDPNSDTSCPKGLHCGTIDGQPYCVRNGGCSVGGGGSPAGLMGLAIGIALLLFRRHALRPLPAAQGSLRS
jgi:secreted trypsin-like serine protease